MNSNFKNGRVVKYRTEFRFQFIVRSSKKEDPTLCHCHGPQTVCYPGRRQVMKLMSDLANSRTVHENFRRVTSLSFAKRRRQDRCRSAGVSARKKSSVHHFIGTNQTVFIILQKFAYPSTASESSKYKG
ncbi:hypothetical protein KPH14_002352 [Odynerus spinipes]|uniref:Uncharacterized protein n=1 Tax=Odynerus spinipes TaxID=1348599 RepID=A0AAD9RLH2_9HYME|nr:hypothetical protein KPH14_002352 [Odynerus spinipes]